MNIVVEHAPVRLREFEVVERKGIGHPDTICDALAERFSVGLSCFYLERFGKVLHHNVDKVLLRGGGARAHFGGGEVLEPIEIFSRQNVTTEDMSNSWCSARPDSAPRSVAVRAPSLRDG